MTLTVLNLRDNRLGNAECEALVAAGAQMQTLKALHLDDNLIHAQGAASVQEHFFADEHLEYLNLSGNPLTDAGAEHIAEMVTFNTKLHTLHLARCGLGEDICKLLDRSLEVNTSLTQLDFVRTQHVHFFLRSPFACSRAYFLLGPSSTRVAVLMTPMTNARSWIRNG